MSTFWRIDSLQQDHECAERNLAEIDRLGQLWLAQGQLSARDVWQFRSLADQLERLYRHHIGVEHETAASIAAKLDVTITQPKGEPGRVAALTKRQ